MNRFGTRLCSIVLCTSILGATMLDSGIPSASADGLFGGPSLSERLQSRRTEGDSLLDSLGAAADRFEEGREERQAMAEAFLEDARSTAEDFRENHPELTAGADEARETLRETAEGLRENLEQRAQGIDGTIGSEESGSGDAQLQTDAAQSENGETPATERFVLDVTKRIEERRAERETQLNRLQDGLESVIAQIDENRTEAEDRVAAVRDALESGTAGTARRMISTSALTEGNTDGQSGTEPDGRSSLFDDLRDRITEIRQQLEENRDNWTQPEDKLEELRTRVEEIRTQLEEAANSEGDGNSRVEELRQQIREMEEKIQQAKEELAEEKTVLWKLKNWIAHPEQMLLFRMLQRLSAPKEHKTVERVQRDTSATGAANYQPAASPTVSPSPTPPPAPTPESPLKTVTVLKEKEEEIGEEEIPLAFHEPVPIKVTPWYLKPEFIIAMGVVIALGSLSAVSALRAGTASARRKKESGQAA